MKYRSMIMELISGKDITQVSAIPMTVLSPLYLTVHGIIRDMSELGSFCGLSMQWTDLLFRLIIC